MYDDTGTEVSEVVLRIVSTCQKRVCFIVVLTINKLDGRLLTSPDIISRGFIYLRDSEELMNDIRQYLKQKVARSFGNRKSELEVIKKRD